MEIIRSIAATLIGGILSPFSGHSAMLSLVPLSVFVGIGMLWIFGRTSNQEAIRKIKAQVQAHLYELRLFTDEPALIWNAQWGLIKTNLRYLSRVLVPVLAMSVPMVLIFSQLECFYGYSPLDPGRDAIVTVHMKDGGPAPSLRAPEGISIESPAIRVDGGREISWRIRALHPLAGDLHFVFPSVTVDKNIQAGIGPRYVSARRVTSALDLIWYPGESRLPAGIVDWIEIRYPSATVHALWLDLHWLIWMLILSMMAGLVLKRRLQVTF